ncbi:hypothetical protein SUGI_0516380 [Cryptomeria japonica]|uniref:uncharacterized protein LOC131064891 isoform X1 n=1 Tax=Cryptomeria japonica TaxID=3369 RepID=UPI002408D821|nr:uncharacterized protein LOC131064891 isoform X1 [Cryptomeria japonica]GLJ26600.1 hypothetical protein SUGI_0516380 [Cryptomeria japonica]
MSGFAPFASNAEHPFRPPALQRQLNIGLNVPLKAIPAVPPPVMSVANPYTVMNAGHCVNEARDKGADNASVVTINDRKVRLSNTGSDSLYTLCRRWVRNDMPVKDQHDPWDTVKPLPRPLSAGVAESNEEKSTEDDKQDDMEPEGCSELEGPMGNISEHQLLQMHVRNAKKIRARLRNERKQRIGRFKQRLALLLPSSMEQNKNDSAVAI